MASQAEPVRRWPSLFRILRGVIGSGGVGVLVSLLILSTGAVAANPVPGVINLSLLSQDSNTLPLAGHMSVLRDPAGEVSLGDVISGPKAGAFTPVNGDLALGYTDDTVWVKTVLRQGRGVDGDPHLNSLTLILSPIFLDTVTVYVPKVAYPRRPEDFNAFVRGDHHVSEQSGRWHLFYSVPLDLAAAAEIPIYFKLKSSSTTALRGAIVTRDGLRDYAINRSAFAVALLVMSGLAMALNLFLWWQSKRRYFFSFALLMLANALLVLGDSGFLLLEGGEWAHYWTDTILGLQVQFTTFTILLFVHDQISARRYFGRLSWFLKAAIALNVIAFATSFSTENWYPVLIRPVYLATTLAVILLFVCNIVIYRRTHKPGSLVAVLASSFQLVLGIVDLTAILGGPDLLGLGEASYWLAMAPFTLLMSLSMIIRAQHLDVRRKEAAGLRVLRRSEKRARALVEERTRELKLAKEKAEEALRAERQMQSEQFRFVDIVRHQYQTPLAVINSSAATMEKTLPRHDEGNRQRVARIMAATSDLVEVLQVSLDRSRMGNAPSKAKRSMVALRSFFATVVRRFEATRRDHALELEFHGVDANDRGFFDKGMVAIALTNLLENSSKFSSPGTTIRLSVERKGDTLRACVTDESIGVPEGEKANVMRRYFRASNAGNVTGTGLGLHIVSHVMEAHNGHFTIENRQPHGTISCLELPDCLSGAAAEAPEE